MHKRCYTTERSLFTSLSKGIEVFLLVFLLQFSSRKEKKLVELTSTVLEVFKREWLSDRLNL